MSKSLLFLAAALAAALAVAPARAAESDAKPKAATHERERDGERHEPAEGTQQYKMKVCNAEAHERDLHGDERRAFMSSCLRK